MQISWIIGDKFDDPLVTAELLGKHGSTWGSWRTWRAYSTDNVLCADESKAEDLIKRAFHSVCNFYIPETSYARLNRPNSVQVFNGEFPTDFDNKEEIIAMHLASVNDIVLLLGFDLQEITDTDPVIKHTKKNYEAAFRGAVKNYETTQWVLVDHPGELDKTFKDFANLSCDSYENVLYLLDSLES
jgi:hypothetical protein